MNEEKNPMLAEGNEPQAEQPIEEAKPETEPVEGEKSETTPAEESETAAEESASEAEAPAAPAEPVAPKVVYRWDYGAQKQYDNQLRRKKASRKSGFAFFGIVSCSFLIVIGLLLGVLVFRDSFSPAKSRGIDTVAIAEKLLPATVLISATQGTTGAVGSGFFVRQNGMIVTNYHVVEGADTLKVKLYQSNVKKEATLVGFNEECDLAVLKIDGSGYPTVTFGDSDALRVGDEAVAIGNPAGTDAEWTVTKGIISSTSRKIMANKSTEIVELKMIQTDAAVNPGNSGGLLCNARGEVIGIIARKQVYRTIGVGSTGETVTVFDEGIGYAIPGNGAKAIIDGLIRLENVDPVKVGLMRVRPKIGITVVSIKEGEKLIDKQIIAAPANGILVTEVGTNGANGVLEPGDIIVKFDGVKVTESDDLIEMMYSYERGDKVKIDVYKNGEFYITTDVELTLGILLS